MSRSDGTPAKTDKLWTPANVVTFVRICLVPVFVAAFLTNWPTWFGLDFISEQIKGLIAGALFVLISCTDWVDGYLARKRNEVTDFGKFLDPLADKILVTAALVALVELQMLPSWPIIIILGREFIVSGVRMIAASKGEVIAASWYGKLKTVFQIIAIVLFILKYSLTFDTFLEALDSPLFVLSWAVMFVALVLTVLSMFDYLSKARHLIGFKRKSSTEKTPNASEIQNEILRLAPRVIGALNEAHATVGTAESLTGGMIAASLTSVPGSSRVFSGGIVSYTDDVKHDVLDVGVGLLETDGAVSESVACAMANNAREKLSVDFAISVTGIAGPSGEEPGKPVGTVMIAVASSHSTRSYRYVFLGNRELVRLQTVLTALSLLLDEIATNQGE